MKEGNLGNQHSRTLKDGQLTPRQDLVMRLLAQGMRSKDVAVRLKVTSHTVASVISSICRNMGTRTLAQSMAVWAVADHLESNEEEE